jgi:hypothetical protein
VALLAYIRSPGGVEFRLQTRGGALPPAEWALADSPRLADGRLARVGLLLRLADDGEAEPGGDAVFLADPSVARLDESERRHLGLPESAAVSLELSSTGGFHDPDFRVQRRLRHRDGRPVVAAEHDGCFVNIAGEAYVLPDPLYSVWAAIDRFNAEASDLERRLLAWGQIRELLPDDVQLDETLGGVQIVVASGFTLNPLRNERGEPDFDPVLGRWVERREGDGGTARTFDPALPPARHREFAKRFRAYPTAQHRYLGGSGVYVVVTERVQAALRVVRDVQGADPGTRRRFLTRPSAFLRDAVETEAEARGTPVDDDLVDDVFFDEGLSDRVKGIGVWEPKVLPWLKASGERWLPDDPAGLLVDGEPVPVPPEKAPDLLEQVRQARREGREAVQIDGRRIPATEATERALEKLVEATRETQEPSDDAKASPRGEKLVLRIIDNLEDLGFRTEPRGSRGSAERVPVSLGTTLLPHQRHGLRWIQQHWIDGSRGALLADDMGLGKTLQALAFLAWLREEMDAGIWPRRPMLVVAPTGLLRNWRDEHDKHLTGDGLGRLVEAFGPGLRNLRAARDAEGRELATGLPSLDVTALGRADWVMTTYETLRDYQHSFGRVHWAVLVFDEAQKIKNPAAGITDAAKAMNQDFTLTMTGTPVENRIEDLWSIVDAARPGELGALKPFSARFSAESAEEVHTELTNLRDRLTAQSVPPIMLRRLKEDHVEGLPTKDIHTHEAPMPARQAQAYREAVMAARRGAPMLQVLQRLRSISLHPSPHEAPDDEFVATSARLKLAIALLDDIRARGEKALVFLESRAVQDVLVELLQRRYRLPHRILVVNGDVSGALRKGRVDEFQERPGFDVMILSPRAGGVGLTLTAANHVIHLARWWNPAVEDQCTDRVYRIGQTRSVHVHHVIAIHPDFGEQSFDVRLAALLDRKRMLNKSVLAPGAASTSELEDLYRSTVGLEER